MSILQNKGDREMWGEGPLEVMKGGQNQNESKWQQQNKTGRSWAWLQQEDPINTEDNSIIASPVLDFTHLLL